MKPSFLSVVALALAACTARTTPRRDAGHGAGAPLALDTGYGSYRRDSIIAAPRARAFFDQGLRLQYAFNHERAVASYQEALRIDSGCAMCWWGIALAAGPTINGPMAEEDGRLAWRAVVAARRLSSRATPVERELIAAIASRYDSQPTAPRPPLDTAYARAMARVADRHGEDPDVLTLYAAALMNLSPWNYWEGDYGRRTPRTGTARILRTLERALALAPNHPGACHYYIHAVEAGDPARALPCAERLAALMPGAGHIVHMPGHIYLRVGRYADAVRANQHAVHADESRIGGQDALGVYAGAYYPHNYHFMAFAATMAGMSAQAIDAARIVAPRVPVAVAREVYWIQNAVVLPALTLLTFARWEEVLAEPVPPEELREAAILARYARGVAQAALGRTDSARAVLSDIRRRASAITEDPATNPIPHIAPLMLAGEIALRQGDAAEAVRRFRAAADIEDALLYDEPPLWYHPVRHALGRALLAAGRPAKAEQAYREDLDKFPENGWSLYGLAMSLQAQGLSAQADSAWNRFRTAWSAADVQPTPSGGVGQRFGSVRLPSGIDLAFAERGDPAGEVLILLHGYSDSWFSYSRVIPLLSERYHVYALDQRGHGRSDQPAAGYQMSDLAADVLAFMDAREIARATLVGHSMGSLVARQVVAAAPDRVKRLVLVGPPSDFSRLPIGPDLRAAVDALTDPVSVTFVREFQYSTVHQPVPAEFMNQAIGQSLRLPARVWKGLLDGQFGMPARRGATGAPTLLMWGELDTVVPERQLEDLKQLYPHARVIVYSATGHAPHWERPVQFVRDLEAFLAQ